MFGNIADTILSTHHIFNDFAMQHSNHLRVEYKSRYDEIFSQDILNLEKLFDSWYQPQKFDFISLRYETLYDQKN